MFEVAAYQNLKPFDVWPKIIAQNRSHMWIDRHALSINAISKHRHASRVQGRLRYRGRFLS